MQTMPVTTTLDPVGAVHAIAVGPECVVMFVPPSIFDRLAPECDTARDGRFYKAAARRSVSGTSIFIANASPPQAARIDRDDAWHRRLELASVLPDLMNGAPGVDLAVVRRRLPVTLLEPSYLEAFPPGASSEQVQRTAWLHTQQRIQTLVAAILDGALTYDVGAYAAQGVAHAHYSHLMHFAWIYAQQIALVDELLDRYPERVITVADLGAGCGHFMVTLARHVVEAGRAKRLRVVGIDSRAADFTFARQALARLPEIESDLIIDDLCCPRFADRLRHRGADVVIANHVLEHLPGDVKNRYLHDWMLAGQLALSLSVPLGDDPERSISTHVALYTPDTIADLAASMSVRVGYTVAARDVERTRLGGLCTWLRAPDVVAWGGFSRTIVTLTPQIVDAPAHRILEDFRTPFDPAAFAHARRAPKIGDVLNRRTFAQIGQPRQVRQLPIKLPGGDVRLPGELSKFAEAVQIIIDHNCATNPDYGRAYAYLNVFQGTTLFSSYRGLSLNCHGDQLQSLHTAYAFPPDWSYIVSSTLPTMLYEQAFDLTDALRRFHAGETVNLYDQLNEQASDANLYRTDNFGIYLLSPYVVHSAANATEDIERVFMKVAFSTKRFFDNRELRRNPAFEIDDWYRTDTVGYVGGWLSHAHWNERFVKDDVCRGWEPARPGER